MARQDDRVTCRPLEKAARDASFLSSTMILVLFQFTSMPMIQIPDQWRCQTNANSLRVASSPWSLGRAPLPVSPSPSSSIFPQRQLIEHYLALTDDDPRAGLRFSPRCATTTTVTGARSVMRDPQRRLLKGVKKVRCLCASSLITWCERVMSTI